MPGEEKHGPPNHIECTEFEALVTDALEGLLSDAHKESLEAHRRVCEICGPMFADVQAGEQWLKSLEAVEPPEQLVYKILAATSGVSTRTLSRAGAATRGGATPFSERLRERWDAFFTPVWAFVRQPRFVMSFGMIFFSFSLAMSAAGVRPADVAKLDLRPSAVRHAYNDAQIKVVQYYDNIRFVYEIESRLRELKRASTPSAVPAPAGPKGNHRNDTSGQPNQKQDRNYSQQDGRIVLAALTGNEEAPPAVMVTTNRRSL